MSDQPTVPGVGRLELFYKSKHVTLYCGDAAAVLAALPRLEADLLATDPPYGQEWRSNRRQDRFDVLAGDDGTLDVVGVLRLALTHVKRSRHAYIFGPADLTDLPLASPVDLVWDKGIVGSGNLTLPWGPQHERIQFAVHQSSKANRESGFGGLTARLRKGSVLSFDRINGSGVKRHPTEKPVPLMRSLIESSSVIGDLVLDPFAGSGSTLVAAVAEGRRAVGVEISEAYCEVAVQRLQAIEALVEKMDAA